MNKKDSIKKQIFQIELQLKKVMHDYSDTDVCNELYNSLVLQKAILKKELENADKNVFVENFKRFIPKIKNKKKTLICDYFN